MEVRRVVWDSVKDIINRREHNIGFDVAQLVFGDPHRIERIDRSEGNTSGEECWQTLGMAGRVLFVVYTERGETPPLNIDASCKQGGKEKLQRLLSHRR
ncbi:MAG: BrnT family toxin [Treponema sp.]|jgi:uncharacterized DUF497 family protein|nr:BrnT family toxin [Treponema sp.]